LGRRPSIRFAARSRWGQRPQTRNHSSNRSRIQRPCAANRRITTQQQQRWRGVRARPDESKRIGDDRRQQRLGLSQPIAVPADEAATRGLMDAVRRSIGRHRGDQPGHQRLQPRRLHVHRLGQFPQRAHHQIQRHVRRRRIQFLRGGGRHAGMHPQPADADTLQPMLNQQFPRRIAQVLPLAVTQAPQGSLAAPPRRHVGKVRIQHVHFMFQRG